MKSWKSVVVPDARAAQASAPRPFQNPSPAAAMRTLADAAGNSDRVTAQRKLGDSLHDSPRMTVQRKAVQGWEAAASANRTGLPDGLKSSIEALSGHSMDQVTVHYNSSKPAQLNALAYAQGNDIHVGPGQEKHLPHEAWHIVQQAQGRVMPTRQLQAGVPVNDERALEREADEMGARAQQHAVPAQLVAAARTDVRGRTIQLRAKDPYERGSSDSPQVHHIISHSKIIGGLAALEPPGQAEVKTAYMPDLTHLSLRQLYNISDRFVFTNPTAPLNDRTLSKQAPDFHDWTEAAVSTLPGTITIYNEGLGFPADTTLLQFRNSYLQVQQDQVGAFGNSEFWDGLKNSYVEWSAGNLFYGAQSRAEPGGTNLDKFDGDAKYFRDAGHVARLKQHEEALDAAANPAAIRRTLLDLAAMNRNAGAGPVNDRTRWITPQNANQKALILALLPDGPRRNFIDNQVPHKTLPRDMVKTLLDEHVDKQIKLALNVQTEQHKLMGMFKAASGEALYWRPHNLPETAVMNFMAAPFGVSLRRSDDQVEITYEERTVAVLARGKKAWKDISADFTKAIKQAMLTSLPV